MLNCLRFYFNACCYNLSCVLTLFPVAVSEITAYADSQTIQYEKLAKNLEAGPADGGTAGVLGKTKEMLWVPPLVGKDPNDPKVIKEFLDGSGFSVEIVDHMPSSKISKGSVISQVPGPYAEVEKPVKIKVVISSGKGK